MKKVLNNFEVYIGTVCSLAMVCILFANVIEPGSPCGWTS